MGSPKGRSGPRGHAGVVAVGLAAAVLVAVLAAGHPHGALDDAHTLAPLPHSAVTADDARSIQRVIRFVLIGATGDLATKYLWVAIFRAALEIHRRQPTSRLQIVAAATDSTISGRAWLDALLGGVGNPKWLARVCGTPDEAEGTAHMVCRAFAQSIFRTHVDYVRLANEADYERLGTTLRRDVDDGTVVIETARIIYLAIPPRFFLQVAEWIDRHLRPLQPPAGGTRGNSGGITKAPLRVIIEKPFGRDLTSAAALARGLRRVLKDEEMLLIDHYAGKPAVRAIRGLVQANPESLASRWNGRHIERVDICMAETETCAGRINYFHHNGILRDVMVNHLQVVLGEVAMAASRANGSLSPAPGQLTAFIRSLRWERRLQVGQYATYASHVEAFVHDNGGKRPAIAHSFVATAATVELHSLDPTWRSTRFVLSAAKATDRRIATIDVTFHGDRSCRVRFVIHEGNSPTRIEVGRCYGMNHVEAPSGWQLFQPVDSITSLLLFEPATTKQRGNTPQEPWTLGVSASAYDGLVLSAILGQTTAFMDLEQVLAAWSVWTPIISAAENESIDVCAPMPWKDDNGWRCPDREVRRVRYLVGASPLDEWALGFDA